MALIPSVKAELFRNPRQRKTAWIPVGFGMVLIILSFVRTLVQDSGGMWYSVDSKFMLLGTAFLLMGGAELLPVDRHRLAALLRFITIGVFIAWFVALLLSQ